MIQLKPNEISTHVTIMVAVGVLFCTTVKASAKPDWEFKLSMPPYFTNYGLLTLRPNNTAPWGSVCNKGFNDVSALAACRSSGYDSITTASIGGITEKDKSLANTGPIYISDVKCNSSVEGPLSLQNCSYSTNTDKCSHYNDVWLQCGKNQLTPVLDFKLFDEPAIGITGDPRVGRMKVKTMVNGPYNDVCGSTFQDVESTAACRTLGFDVTHAGRISKWKFMRYNYSMNYVKCPTKNSGLKDCTYKLDPEDRFKGLLSFCLGPLILDCHERHPDKWKFRIQESDTPGIGRLEMQPDESHGWGTVCSNLFNDHSALMMCKAVGYTDITSARAILNYSSVGNPTARSVNTITYLTDFVCDENSTSLTNCTYAYNPQGISPSSVCTSMTDVGIECSSAPITKGPSVLPIVLGVIGAGILVGLAVGGVILYKKHSVKSGSSMNDVSDRVDYVAMDDQIIN